MIRSLRTGFFALLMVASLVVAGSAVSAATSTATLSGGSLTLAAPASFSYSGTLTGDVLNLGSNFAVSVNDATGSKAGWQLQASVGVLTDAASDTIARRTTRSRVWPLTGTTGHRPGQQHHLPDGDPDDGGEDLQLRADEGDGQVHGDLHDPAGRPGGCRRGQLHRDDDGFDHRRPVNSCRSGLGRRPFLPTGGRAFALSHTRFY